MTNNTSGDDNTKHYTKLSQNIPDRPMVNQSRIIDRLKGYFDWHHFPRIINTDGICRGLSSVFAKYIVQGKGNEFLDILSTISGDIQPSSEHDNFINHFAVEVAMTQLPKYFENRFAQKNSIECLEIEGERLFPSFSFAMCTKDENWAEIIGGLNLDREEPMLVSGKNHSVCVLKSHGKPEGYLIYDPNYPEGIRHFTNEAALIQELHERLDRDGLSKSLAIKINVIRHPALKEKRIPLYPTAISLYEKYLSPIKANTTGDSAEINSNLHLAAAYADAESIVKLIEFGATDFSTAALKAIFAKNNKTLQVLVPRIDESTNIQVFFETAFECGSEEIIDTLRETRTPDYKSLLAINAEDSTKNLQNSVAIAAAEGNLPMIKKILSDAKKMLREDITLGGNTNFQDKELDDLIAVSVFKIRYYYHRVIVLSIMSGNAECVRELIELSDSSSCALSEEYKLRYLMFAIQENQSSVVKYLLTQISHENLERIKMSAYIIDKTELSILLQLKQHGMILSEVSEAIIQKKEHQTISFDNQMLIIFLKYTEYLRDIILRIPGLRLYTDGLKSNKDSFFQADEKKKAPTQSSQTIQTKVFIRDTENRNAISQAYEKEFQERPGYQKPILSDGGVILYLPSAQDANDFFTRKAREGTVFFVAQVETNTVTCYSNGDGSLFHSDGTVFQKEDVLGASEVSADKFSIPEPTCQPGRGF